MLEPDEEGVCDHHDPDDTDLNAIPHGPPPLIPSPSTVFRQEIISMFWAMAAGPMEIRGEFPLFGPDNRVCKHTWLAGPLAKSG